MEVSKEHLQKLQIELEKRHKILSDCLNGEEFTTKDKTPWKHMMDDERRKKNKFVNKMNLALALEDFKSILKEIQKIK
jgi:hypothetical protein